MLASEEGIADITSLNHDHFTATANREGGPVIDEDRVSIPFAEPVDGADAGMEVEGSMCPQDLASNLDFVDGLPLLFNPYRHRGGSTPWELASVDTFNPNGPEKADLDFIKLHWHQLAGVHAMARLVFSSTPNNEASTSVLLADEVGLGKTFQAATMISFLTDLVILQEKGYPLPPMIGRTYLLYV